MNPLQRTPMFARVTNALAATLLAVGCRDATGPTPLRPTQPAFAQFNVTQKPLICVLGICIG